jgi:hypothetical protein
MPAKASGTGMYTRVADDVREHIEQLAAITGLSQSMVIHSLCRKALDLPGVLVDPAIRAVRELRRNDDGASDSTG